MTALTRRLGLLGVAALLAGCGSTVQVTGSAGVGSLPDGNGQPLPVATTAAGQPSAPGPGTAPGGSVPTDGGSAPAVVAPGATASAPLGAARITAPLELGFMTTNVGNAQSAGINVGQTYPDKAAYEALVKEYNAEGGLAGRRIIPSYGTTDTASSDWNTQFQAACQNLTQDHHVKAVLGYVFVFLDSFEQCLSRKGIPHLYGGYSPGDVQSQREYPHLVSVAHPSTNVGHLTVFTGATATGRLTKRSRLGVLMDSCGHEDRAFKVTGEPFLKKHGIPYETIYKACETGSADNGATVAAVQSAVLQFNSHGVDVVYIPNGVALLLFMNNAESQGYRPQYVNQGAGGALEAQGSAVPQAQERNLHSFGWTPAIDVGPSHQPYVRTPQQTECLAKLKRQGLVPQQYNDFMFAFVTCDSFDLYARALAITGGRTEAAEVTRALLQVMPGVRGALTYGGAFSVSSLQRGGPGRYRESGWSDSCSCFTYRGPVRSVPGS